GHEIAQLPEREIEGHLIFRYQSCLFVILRCRIGFLYSAKNNIPYPETSPDECTRPRRARSRDHFPGRQIHAGERPRLYQRHAGARASADAAKGARSQGRAEYGGLHFGLSRLAARRARSVAVEGEAASEGQR